MFFKLKLIEHLELLIKDRSNYLLSPRNIPHYQRHPNKESKERQQFMKQMEAVNELA